MASPSKRVLITGVGGFTGRWLSMYLSEVGYTVHGLVHRGPVGRQETIADLADSAQLRSALNAVRPDFIVHLAAITFVPHGDIAEMYRTNLIGTLNLLDAALAIGLQPRKILLAGSANVYGNPPVEVIDETVCPAPVNHYAASKLTMEHMARTYCDRLPIIITRPFNYTGPGQAGHFLIPKIVNHYRERRTAIELGNLDVIRDFSDVRFVTHVYRLLLESEIQGETVNVCSGQGVALGEIIEQMNRIAGYAISVRVNPDFVRTNEVRRLIGSPHRLFALIGAVPIIPINGILQNLYHSPA